MKELLIEEFREATKSYSGGVTRLKLFRLVKNFAESDDEVWELEDEDIGKTEGYLASIYGKTKKGVYKACAVNKVAKEVINELQLEEFVHSQTAKGRLFLVKKDLL